MVSWNWQMFGAKTLLQIHKKEISSLMKAKAVISRWSMNKYCLLRIMAFRHKNFKMSELTEVKLRNFKTAGPSNDFALVLLILYWSCGH